MASTTEMKEVWLRGPIPGITPMLQPVAHALLQAQEEVTALMKDFPLAMLWQKPAGAASAGFHLQHLSGVLDRLFTYADNQSLSEEQLYQLAAEGKEREGLTADILVTIFTAQVQVSIDQLRIIPENSLLETRSVGRAQIPSTVLGLLVHSAEHTQRHVGQLLVTVKLIKYVNEPGQS